MGFSTEQELVDLFKTSFSSKFNIANKIVLEEVSLGFGIADLVVTELKDSLHNYDGGLAIERRDSGRIKY